MQLRILLFFLTIMFCFCTANVQAGTYLSSAHGNTTYGVDRPDLNTAGFAVANCAHCHEQHASVGGSEPAPVTTPQEYLLFDQSNTDQATNFCFDCHGTGIAYQTSGHVTNRSYSFRAGGWVGDPVNNIKSAFAQASSHDLADIVTFVDGQAWKYTANSNACAVCHDPHVVQGDPADDPNSSKPGLGRGVAITEVNSSPPNLWGDGLIGINEIMNQYAPLPSYQAPYRVGGLTYEPAGSTQDGSDLPNYVAFCTKCHDASNTIYSTNLGRNLKVIDWTANGDKHGKRNADVDIRMNLPYIQGAPPVLQAGGYVLSCLDCHEPHGSGNQSLIRDEVNGVVTQLTGVVSGGQFNSLCRQCHNPVGGASDWHDPHHVNDQPFLKGGSCNSNAACHNTANAPVNRINCANCHYHGAQSGDNPGFPVAKPFNLDANFGPTGRYNF
jgi:cytochrome c553